MTEVALVCRKTINVIGRCAGEKTLKYVERLQKLPIPVNIITGALGVGKTTTILHLLSQKPTDEKWAVLVNEFGSLGIDGSILEGSSNSMPGVVVRELAGGCLCCTLNGPLGVAIAQIVRTAKPDRLIIEPSGMGHPAGLLDVLQNEHLRSALTLQAIICLVDVRRVQDPAFLSLEAYQDQVNVADVLVGHKLDCASSEQVQQFHEWAEELYPPKLQVLTASHGQVGSDLLNICRQAAFQPFFRPTSGSRSHRSRHQQPTNTVHALSPVRHMIDSLHLQGNAAVPSSTLYDDHDSQSLQHAVDAQNAAQPSAQPSHVQPSPPGAESSVQNASADVAQQQLAPTVTPTATSSQPAAEPQPGRPVRYESCDDDFASGGWMFHPDDTFDAQALGRLLDALRPVVARVKGVFRTGKSFSVANMTSDGQRMKLQPIAYRRESRMEVIVPRPAAKAATTGTPACANGAASLPHEETESVSQATRTDSKSSRHMAASTNVTDCNAPTLPVHADDVSSFTVHDDSTHLGHVNLDTNHLSKRSNGTASHDKDADPSNHTQVPFHTNRNGEVSPTTHAASDAESGAVSGPNCEQQSSRTQPQDTGSVVNADVMGLSSEQCSKGIANSQHLVADGADDSLSLAVAVQAARMADWGTVETFLLTLLVRKL